jgi:hypothetical protein
MSLSLLQNKVMSFDIGYEGQPKRKKELVIQESSSEESEQQPNYTYSNPDQIKIPVDEPIYGKGPDGVQWKKPEYIHLWNILPIALKNELRPNHEWMKRFMFDCVNKRANKQTCKFVEPKDLKLPPEKLENGQYDVGVKIYSDVFNKLDESLQKTYLTLYSTEDGVKNYDMLITALNNLVAKEVKFDRSF